MTKKKAKPKAAKNKAAPKKSTPRKPAPRTPRLPGMEDAKLETLHQAALDYAQIRDERQALTSQEVELKGKLLDLMHAAKRETYSFENVVVTLVHEEETVKVKIKKAKDVDVDVIDDSAPSEPEEELDPDNEYVEDEASESGEELEP